MKRSLRPVALCVLAVALPALVVACKGSETSDATGKPADSATSSTTPSNASPTGDVAGSPQSDTPEGRAAAAPPDAGRPAQPGMPPTTPPAPAIPLVPSGPPAQVVAKVNGRSITRAELDFAIKNVVQQQVPPEKHAQVRHDVLNSLIDQELVYQKAMADKVDVTPAELSASMAKVKADFPDEKVFVAELAKDGMTPASIESMIHHAMVIEKYVKNTIVGRVTVTPEDETKFYQANLEAMKHPEQVRASHILLRIAQGAPADQKAAQKAKAQEALGKARSGSDFAALAKEYSQDPVSAQRGGDLGFFGKGRMMPDFEKVAFALKVGAISDVVETSFGYHIIKVTDHRDAGVAPIDAVRPGIRDRLKGERVQGEVQKLTEGLRKQAKIETSL